MNKSEETMCIVLNLIEMCIRDRFKTYKVNNAVLVKLKEDDNIKEQVVKYAIDNVRASKATGVELAILGRCV